MPGEWGVAGTAVGGDACVAGGTGGAAFTAGRLRGVGSGSSDGSGKLFTVSALSQPPEGGSESKCDCTTAGARGVIGLPGIGGGAPRPLDEACGLVPVPIRGD